MEQPQQETVERYSRQMVLGCFGVESQRCLSRARVLVVGAGGLGCPAAMYLVGAGVGALCLLDRHGDCVERSNLHRQIAYNDAVVGVDKAEALAQFVRNLNPRCDVQRLDSKQHGVGICAANAEQMVQGFDVVLDCTDNVMSRYVLSDACALQKVPLVSGAAIGTDGQLSVYCSSGAKDDDTPCYRCVHPVAPPQHCVGSCDSAGVLGPVPGIIGTLQAIEAIKVICGASFVGAEPLRRKMLLFDAMDCSFRTMKLRARSSACIACSSNSTSTQNRITRVNEYDYDAFLMGDSAGDSAAAAPAIAPESRGPLPSRIEALEFSRISNESTLLVDVRPNTHFQMCHLPGAMNVPLTDLSSAERVRDIQHEMDRRSRGEAQSSTLYIICRRGNDSQKAARKLSETGLFHRVVDIMGGLSAWSDQVDPTFPKY